MMQKTSCAVSRTLLRTAEQRSSLDQKRLVEVLSTTALQGQVLGAATLTSQVTLIS